MVGEVSHRHVPIMPTEDDVADNNDAEVHEGSKALKSTVKNKRSEHGLSKVITKHLQQNKLQASKEVVHLLTELGKDLQQRVAAITQMHHAVDKATTMNKKHATAAIASIVGGNLCAHAIDAGNDACNQYASSSAKA